MSIEYIALEKPIADLELKIDELRRVASTRAINLDREIANLEKKAERLRDHLFKNLTPYQTTQFARHPRRPTTLELINSMCSDFVELHGDRNFQDDKAIVGGVALMDGYSMIILGHQKGRGTKDNIYRNFGMPRPEGYRKALRLMSLAERFNRPIITFVDTPGAYPGIGAEERGQSEAIAKNIMVMSRLKVPIISVIIGEGGSGGALAIAVANRVHMLRHSIYSVISPEGCASILFKDAGKAPQAADALKLTPDYALRLGVVDTVIEEPRGGAHRNVDVTAANIKNQLLKDLDELGQMSGNELRDSRMNKYLRLGDVVDLK